MLYSYKVEGRDFIVSVMGGFDMMSAVFPVIFIIVFLSITAVVVFSIVRMISQYRKNEAAPLLTVAAKVMTKREDVTHSHGTQESVPHTSTSYHVTFEVESGDRLELSMSGKEFGMLAEGDKGRLSFQGTRYKGFERTNED
jgi:hypothetical protein